MDGSVALEENLNFSAAANPGDFNLIEAVVTDKRGLPPAISKDWGGSMNAHSWLEQHLLNVIQRKAPVPIRLGLKPDCEGSRPPLTMLPVIQVKDRQTLIALLCNPSMNFGDLYSAGRIDVEGDLIRLLEKLYEIPESPISRIVSRLSLLMPSNSMRAARRNIRHHYDLSTDFYRMWLDSQLVYTCAYFPHRSATLEDAQRAKLDLVCRKLWLRPGETVIEGGCGWGALAIHMAKFYGVRVRAFNISREQIAYAREQVRREGLCSLVEFHEDDYRNISGKSDAFVSVGMLEHVGRSHYHELARVIHRTIGKNGRGLLHFIGRNYPYPFHPWIRKRIFPGAYVPALREVVKLLEPHDFSVLDIENLCSHYARTLELWLSKFESSYACVVERFGESFARMWRLYLAGSSAAFHAGTLQLFQIVFAGRACDSRPWNREYLYSNSTQHNERDLKWTHVMS